MRSSEGVPRPGVPASAVKQVVLRTVSGHLFLFACLHANDANARCPPCQEANPVIAALRTNIRSSWRVADGLGRTEVLRPGRRSKGVCVCPACTRRHLTTSEQCSVFHLPQCHLHNRLIISSNLREMTRLHALKWCNERRRQGSDLCLGAEMCCRGSDGEE